MAQKSRTFNFILLPATCTVYRTDRSNGCYTTCCSRNDMPLVDGHFRPFGDYDRLTSVLSTRHGTGSLGHRVTGSQNVTLFHVWYPLSLEDRLRSCLHHQHGNAPLAACHLSRVYNWQLDLPDTAPYWVLHLPGTPLGTAPSSYCADQRRFSAGVRRACSSR